MNDFHCIQCNSLFLNPFSERWNEIHVTLNDGSFHLLQLNEQSFNKHHMQNANEPFPSENIFSHGKLCALMTGQQLKYL